MNRKTVCRIGKRASALVLAALCLTVCMLQTLYAEEEGSGYYDEAGNWVQDSWTEDVFPEEQLPQEDTEHALMTGSYSVEAGWSIDSAAGTEGKTVYRQDANLGVEGTSTIACSYLDTNYSVLEYEQLRDMLTNNLLYSNVNAQISTSAAYTQSRDYLYIVIVDDSAQDYRDIYHYVVGDYRCFCVEVREYRAEAEQALAAGQKTPQEVGQSTAEGFVWDAG